MHFNLLFFKAEWLLSGCVNPKYPLLLTTALTTVQACFPKA